jgi:hypothetical protein
MSFEEEKQKATYRRHHPGASVYGNPMSSAELHKIAYYNEHSEQIDPCDKDRISEAIQAIKKSREANRPMAEHRQKIEGMQIRRSNLLAEIRNLEKEKRKLLDEEKNDSDIANAGIEKRLEIQHYRQRHTDLVAEERSVVQRFIEDDI